MAAPLGNIDKLVVIDQGNGTSESAPAAWAVWRGQSRLVFNVLQQLEALGLSVPRVLQQLGVSTVRRLLPTRRLLLRPSSPRATPVRGASSPAQEGTRTVPVGTR